MADDAYIGEIRIFPFAWAPEGWMPCDGRELPVQQYQALFSILENTYGGKPQRTFCLPDLRGLAVMGPSEKAGDGGQKIGETVGTASVTLQIGNLPAHTHALTGATLAGNPSAKTAAALTGSRLSRLETQTGVLTTGILRTYVAPAAAGKRVTLSAASIDRAGASGTTAPHENRQPFCTMNFCICVDGEYPIS